MNNSSVLKNMVWKFSERIAAQIVTFVVSILLARLLTPEDYGLVSIVTIFITLANVFVSDGFGTALIQKKEADEVDFSSVLYFNIAFSILLYLVLYLSAPLLASFYGDGYELLTPVLRVLGIRIIVTGINSVQQAYISKKMEFKKFFWATLIGTVLSAIAGITMAMTGFGVWALVVQYLTNTIINTVVLCFITNLKIVPQFSFLRLRQLLSYGYKILLSKLLITGFQELRALIIGKMYSSADLAYYDKGKQLPNLIVANVDASIGAVLFPKLAEDQDNVERLKFNTRRSIRFSSYIMSPLMLGLAAVAKPLISILLTEKWLPCVPLMQVFCITYLFQPIHTANLQAIKAIGESGVFLRLEIAKKIIEVIVLLITMQYGVTSIVIGQGVLAIMFTFVNAYPNKRLIGYSFKEQMADIFPPILMAIAMMIAILPITHVASNLFVQVAMQVLAGGIIYLILSHVTKNQEFRLIMGTISTAIRKR